MENLCFSQIDCKKKSMRNRDHLDALAIFAAALRAFGQTAASRPTPDAYRNALMTAKREANSKVVRMAQRSA
jgi:hypothetical protein